MKWYIIKSTREISQKNKKEISEGCTLEQSDIDNEIQKTFNTKEEALEGLKQYSSTVEKFTSAITYFLVTEYYVMASEEDNDDELDFFMGIYEFSPFSVREDLE